MKKDILVKKQIRLILSGALISLGVHAIELPQTLTELEPITDKNSIEYQIQAYKAAIDTKNAAQVAIDSGKTEYAIRLLAEGLKLMSHRDDLRKFRNQAIDLYLEVTLRMEKSHKLYCAILMHRYDVLKEVATDKLSLTKNDRSCAKTAVSANTESIGSFGRAELDNQALELKFKADADSTAGFVERGKDFPSSDILDNSFLLFIGLYGNSFQINCDLGGCRVASAQADDFESTVTVFNQNLKSMLEVESGTDEVRFLGEGKGSFRTSKYLAEKWKEVMHENKPEGLLLHRFFNRAPSCVVFEVNVRKNLYKTRAHTFVGYLPHKQVLLPKAVREKYFPEIYVVSAVAESASTDEQMANCIRGHRQTGSSLTSAITEQGLNRLIFPSDILSGKEVTITINDWTTINEYRRHLFHLPNEITAHENSGSAKAYDDEEDVKPAPQSGPSFNCAKAKSFSEKAICADTELSEADRKISGFYKTLLKSWKAKVIRNEQKAFLVQRENCTTVDCLRELHRSRLKQLTPRETE